MNETKCTLKKGIVATQCNLDIRDESACWSCGWWEDEARRRKDVLKRQGLTRLCNGRYAFVEKKKCTTTQN